MSLKPSQVVLSFQESRVSRDLARRSRASVLAHPLLWALIVAFSDMVDEPFAILLFEGVVFVVLALFRFYLVSAHASWGQRKPIQWRRSFLVTAWITAAAWGAFCCYVLMNHQLDDAAMLTLLCTAGIAAGASNSLSPCPSAAITYLGLLLLPSAAALFALQETAAIGTALMFLAYLAMLIAIVRAQSAEYRSALANEAELARHVQELELARDAADAAAAAKTRFLGTISHEIRTPLNGVLGMIELVRGNTRAEDDLMCLNAAYRSGERLLNLLGNIVDYVAFESGELRAQASLAKLEELIANALSDVRGEYPRASEALIDIAEDVPGVISVDGSRFSMALKHLLNNAFKFSSQGEVRIDVRLTRRPSSSDDLRCIGDCANDIEHGGRQWLRCAVMDQGIGVDKSIVPFLFEPFSQADGSLTRSYEGAGLGLAIVRRVVLSMNGCLGFSSSPNHGSHFWFALPFYRVNNGLASLVEPDRFERLPRR